MTGHLPTWVPILATASFLILVLLPVLAASLEMEKDETMIQCPVFKVWSLVVLLRHKPTGKIVDVKACEIFPGRVRCAKVCRKLLPTPALQSL